jgi:NADP-reducing hydrogenase subunit HndD
MEAALRYAVELLNGKPLEKVEFEAVRGIEGIREATVEAGGLKIKAAIASGTGNAKKLLDKIKNGEAEYHFVEIMACPGGCVNGGGQPIQPSSVRSWVDLRTERAKALYEEDESLPLRKSQDNPFVKKLYEEYLGHPGSEKAHKLLHTHYTPRENYPGEE